MIAAVGTASSAPTKPSSSLPISSAMITVTALRPTVSPITFGTSTVFSSCCCTRKNTATPSARPGDTVNATTIAGIAESSGPTIGIISPMPAINASTKKYGTPISAKTDRRRRADDEAEQDLAAEPRADLDRSPAR